MFKQILVPLKKHDRLEAIVPYIEKVGRPGATLVFVIPHPVKELKWLQAYGAIAQCGLEKSVAVRRMIESYSLRMRRQMTERRVFQTCAKLHDMALKICVDMYTGSLRQALRSYAGDDDTAVILQPGIAQRIASFLRGAVSLRKIFANPFPSSVMLYHTGR